MRSCSLRVILKSNKESHYKREKIRRHEVTEREHHVMMEAEIGAIHLQTRRAPRIARSHQKLGERHGADSPSEPPEGPSLQDILILNIWFPELERNKYV